MCAPRRGYNGLVTLKPPFDRITIEPDKMGGQPCIRGLRLTVKRVLEILGSYTDRTELFADYPDLEEADVQQTLSFAAAHLARFLLEDLRNASDAGASPLIEESLASLDRDLAGIAAGSVKPLDEYERESRF
jgi:uncharacterized protein (DUF433 family)